jgi:RNA polymerase sigma-B factor
MLAHDGARTPSSNDLEDLDAAALGYAARLTTASPSERPGLRTGFTHLCLPFAGRLARRYRGRGEPIEDLEQVARLGLVKAIDRYDAARGSFTAYAMVTISGEIKRHFRDKTWVMRVPRRIQELSSEISNVTTTLTNTLSRTPTAAEIAERLGVGDDNVTEALGSLAGYSPASLNARIGAEDGAELGDLLGDMDPDLEAVDDKIAVADLLLRLPPRERRMLVMRFYGNRTQAEIAADLGLSQMHVSRLLSRALSWLRAAMLNDTPPHWEGIEPLPQRHDVEILVRQAGDATTVQVRGEVDRDTATELRMALRSVVAAATVSRVVVDLREVPLFDAAGVAALLDARAAAAAAKMDLRLAGAQPCVASVLAVSGLGTLSPNG